MRPQKYKLNNYATAMNAAQYESCFESLSGTPTRKRTNSVLGSPRQRTPQSAKATRGDRFIPNRSALDLDIAHYNLVKENANANDLDLAAEVASPSKVRRLSVNILSATIRSRRVKPFPLDRASPIDRLTDAPPRSNSRRRRRSTRSSWRATF